MSEHPSLELSEKQTKVDINLNKIKQYLHEAKTRPESSPYSPLVLVVNEPLKETVGNIIEVYNELFNEFIAKLNSLDIKKPEVQKLSEQLTDYSEQILTVLTHIADLLKEKHENADLEREVLTKLRDRLG